MSGSPLPRAMVSLRRFVEKSSPEPFCDLCGGRLPADHEHLLDAERRHLACACAACARLFPDSPGGAYRRISSHLQRVEGVLLDEDAFASLGIPVRLAFIVPSRAHRRIFALYPNAAGTVEARVPEDAWLSFQEANPSLAGIEPDVEAALLDGLAGPSKSQAYRASIDVCHRFMGLLRTRGPGSVLRERSLAHLLEELEGAGHA